MVASLVLSSACAELVRGGNHYVLDEDTDEGAGTDLACTSGLTACSNQCVVLASDASNCGWCGHDCQGASCEQGTCAAVEVVVGLDDPHDLTVSGGHVYWTGDAAVERAPKEGGTAEVVADKQAVPNEISVDSSGVLWKDDGSRRLMWLAMDEMGKAPTALFSAPASGSPPVGLAMEKHNAYFFCHDFASGDLCSVKTNGNGNDKEATLATGQPAPTHVRVLGGELLWAGFVPPNDDPNTSGQLGAGSYVRSMPAGGGAVRTIASEEGEIVQLTLSSGFAIWADATNRRIRISDIADGAPETLVDDQDVVGLTADEDGVVWSTAGGSVKSCSLTGGAVHVLASDIANVGAVALDKGQVYFLRTGADGAVLRVPR